MRPRHTPTVLLSCMVAVAVGASGCSASVPFDRPVLHYEPGQGARAPSDSVVVLPLGAVPAGYRVVGRARLQGRGDEAEAALALRRHAQSVGADAILIFRNATKTVRVVDPGMEGALFPIRRVAEALYLYRAGAVAG